MKGVISSIRDSQVLKMAGAVVAGTFLVVSVVSAATTISTNIQTDGTLSVTGQATLVNASSTELTNSGAAWINGALALASTLNVTGKTTLVNASSTLLTNSGASWFNGATTLSSTLGVTGQTTLVNASSTLLTNSGQSWFGGNVAINGSAPVLTVAGTGATSTVVVGCVQTYATSTATPVKFIMGAANTSASTSITSTTPAGFVVWAYGSCPSF